MHHGWILLTCPADCTDSPLSCWNLSATHKKDPINQNLISVSPKYRTLVRTKKHYRQFSAYPFCFGNIWAVPEYMQSNLCTPHTGYSVVVPAADGADPHPFLFQGNVQSLGCPATSSGTKMDTSHKTGQTDRPDMTCTQSRTLSGRAPGTGKRSP